jgi:serine/threonine protein kinase
MRGYSQTERVSKDTFILLDRLYGTLKEKFPWWREYMADLQGMNKATSCCGRGGSGGSGTNATDKSPAATALLQERLLVAYDLCRAIQYLHDRRLVYRDIKPQNMGFDIRGDLKLFDFGLCKSLEPGDRCQDGSYGYHLTIITGSIPYMAPEVAMKKPYDQEADVYSFSVLLWELMSLECAYKSFDANKYFFRVCVENHRERISTSWPAIVKIIIKEGWDPNPQKRPDMKRIGTLLRGELQDLTTDAAVVNRTQHLLNRSRQSFRRLMDSSRGSTGSGKHTSEGKSSTRLPSRMERDSFAAGNTYGTDEGRVQ